MYSIECVNLLHLCDKMKCIRAPFGHVRVRAFSAPLPDLPIFDAVRLFSLSLVSVSCSLYLRIRHVSLDECLFNSSAVINQRMLIWMTETIHSNWWILLDFVSHSLSHRNLNWMCVGTVVSSNPLDTAKRISDHWKWPHCGMKHESEVSGTPLD